MQLPLAITFNSFAAVALIFPYLQIHKFTSAVVVGIYFTKFGNFIILNYRRTFHSVTNLEMKKFKRIKCLLFRVGISRSPHFLPFSVNGPA